MAKIEKICWGMRFKPRGDTWTSYKALTPLGDGRYLVGGDMAQDADGPTLFPTRAKALKACRARIETPIKLLVTIEEA